MALSGRSGACGLSSNTGIQIREGNMGGLNGAFHPRGVVADLIANTPVTPIHGTLQSGEYGFFFRSLDVPAG